MEANEKRVGIQPPLSENLRCINKYRMAENGVTIFPTFKNYIESSDVTEKRNISEIIKNYGSRLKGFIRKRVSSNEDADDILQDVYYQLADADRMMKPIDEIASWLFTVARNKITDLYRKKKAVPVSVLASDDDEDSLPDELTDLLFDDGSTPETEYLRSLVWTELDKALNELPEEQRFVFEQTEMKGLSFKEISEQTGEPVNTLISRKRYAVLYLRERLKVLYDDFLNF